MKRIALVTGGNRGIGLEICRQLAKNGYEVIMGSRSISNGKRTQKELKEEGLDVIMEPLDVENEEQIGFLASWVETEYGKLDVLVNNAGIGVGNNGIADVDLEEVKKIMAINFYGPMMMNKYFLPLLKQGNSAKIINVSSGMGSISEIGSGYAGYRLSKAGLNVQTMLLAQEVQQFGIEVYSVCPGWVKTDMGGESAPRSVDQGADTIVWLANEEKRETGKFYRDRKVIQW